MQNSYIKSALTLAKVFQRENPGARCMATNNDSTSTDTVLYVVVVVVAVLVASVLAPVVWSATRGSGEETETDHPTVSVITLRGGTSQTNAASMVEDLREARTNESVEAVVLRIDSGGGPVTSSEELYLAVNRTAQEMPVVTYVEGLAASGGYYTIAPSDAIYVKPSSQVGSVGVVATIPEIVEQSNDARQVFIRSGPNKQVTTVDEIRDVVESFQNAFLDTVMKHRGDELSLSEREVGQAGVYIGTRAVENGFADDVGSLESAIQRAAEESDAIEGTNYTVRYREPVTPTGGLFFIDDGSVERRDGNVVYVDTTSRSNDEFVKPVRFYAVYGIPEGAIADDPSEVTTNESN